MTLSVKFLVSVDQPYIDPYLRGVSPGDGDQTLDPVGPGTKFLKTWGSTTLDLNDALIKSQAPCNSCCQDLGL